MKTCTNIPVIAVPSALDKAKAKIQDKACTFASKQLEDGRWLQTTPDGVGTAPGTASLR